MTGRAEAPAGEQGGADDRERPGSGRRSIQRWLGEPNIRQTVTTVVLAVLLAVGAWFSGAANAEWQSSVREEVVWSAAAGEILRHVYGDEAPWALEIAIAQERGTAVAAAAESAGDLGGTARFESAIDVEWAAQLRAAHADRDHLVNDQYWRDGSGFDVSARIVDMQRRNADVLSRDPERFLRAGDRDRAIAEGAVAAALPLVAGYIVVELLLWRRHRAGRRGGVEPVLVGPAHDVALVPRPWVAPRTHRYATSVAFAAWVLVGVLPLAQLQAQHMSGRASSQSSRAAVQTAAAVVGGAQLASFQLSAQRAVELGAEQRLMLRDWAAGEAPDDLAAEQYVAVGAQRDALPAVRAVADAMVAAPAISAGVDERLVAVAISGPATWQHLQSEQLRLLDVADDAGRSADIFALALLLAVLALSLAALAATPMGRRSFAVSAAPASLVVCAAALAVVGTVS